MVLDMFRLVQCTYSVSNNTYTTGMYRHYMCRNRYIHVHFVVIVTGLHVERSWLSITFGKSNAKCY